MRSALHDDAIVFDGVVISNWSRQVFQAMRDGGITAANCTISVWQGFEASMDMLGRFKGWFREHGDLIVQAYTVDDIRRAKQDGKVGVVLGFQNTTAFGDRLHAIEIFRELGVGVAQMTYNTANLVGCGCYEGRDSGLTDFGRQVVSEMNRVGMLCDLSHVGPETSRDVIETSTRPVAYTHCCPAALRPHPRNKSDSELRFLAERDGFVGVTMIPAFLPRGVDSSVEDVIDAVEYCIDLCGEEQVGLASDFSQGYEDSFLDYLNRDKGDLHRGRKLVDFGAIVMPEGIGRLEDFPNLTAAMERRRWTETRIRRVLGENWLRFLDHAWAAPDRPK
jgi:membrane dipeptidase